MAKWLEFEIALLEFEKAAVNFKNHEIEYLRVQRELHALEEVYSKLKSECIDRAMGLNAAEGKNYGEAFRVFVGVFGARRATEHEKFLASYADHRKVSADSRVRKPKAPIVHSGSRSP